MDSSTLQGLFVYLLFLPDKTTPYIHPMAGTYN